MNITSYSSNASLAAVLGSAVSALSLLGCASDQDVQPLPLVTIVCQAPGMSSEEIERQVTSQLEESITGCAGVRRHGSVSQSGQATIWVQFDHSVDIYNARRVVAERLASVELPLGVEPRLAPPLQGDVLLLALQHEAASDAKTRDQRAAELRDFADDSLRRQLLVIRGVSQVTVTGGTRRRLQVLVSPERLRAYEITLRELAHAMAPNGPASAASNGAENSGILVRAGNLAEALEVIETTVVRMDGGRPVRVADVAEVRIVGVVDRAHAVPTGKPSRAVDVELAVILAIGLQPDADRSSVSEAVKQLLQQLGEELPRDVIVQQKIDPQLNDLVGLALQDHRRELPPDLQLIRRSSGLDFDYAVASWGDRFEVRAFGPDLAILQRTSESIRQLMLKVAGVVDVQIQPPADEPRLTCQIDRERAAELGWTVEDLAEQVQFALDDSVISQVRCGNSTYDVVMKTIHADDDAKRIAETLVRTPAGQLVALSQLVDLQLVSEPHSIFHENKQRMMRISCRIADRDRSAVESDLRKALAPMLDDIEAGYHIQYGAP